MTYFEKKKSLKYIHDPITIILRISYDLDPILSKLIFAAFKTTSVKSCVNMTTEPRGSIFNVYEKATRELVIIWWKKKL
jgi:hypothetical protein